MTIPFTRWPEDFARRYREKGYWQDLPLTHILTDHADSDAVAIIDGDRRITYRNFNQAVNNLASALQAQGLHRGETALVQLGNVAEFYMTFFALLHIGVAPVNALFSHQRSELNAYAMQIKPAVLIADRDHALFAGDDFLNTFVDAHRSVRVVLLRGDKGEHAPTRRLRVRRTISSRTRRPPMKWPSFSFPGEHRHAETDPAHAQRLRLQHPPQQRDLRHYREDPLSERATRST